MRTVEAPAPPMDAVIQARAMTRALVHGRPILNGYSGYFPAGFPERMARVDSLPNREALRRLREETGLETVVLLRRRLGMDEMARWQREFDDPTSPYRRTWQDDVVIVVDVVDVPAAPTGRRDDPPSTAVPGRRPQGLRP